MEENKDEKVNLKRQMQEMQVASAGDWTPRLRKFYSVSTIEL
jgi:hypothetical protein